MSEYGYIIIFIWTYFNENYIIFMVCMPQHTYDETNLHSVAESEVIVICG